MGTKEHNTQVFRTRTYVFESGLNAWKQMHGNIGKKMKKNPDEKNPEVLTSDFYK